MTQDKKLRTLNRGTAQDSVGQTKDFLEIFIKAFKPCFDIKVSCITKRNSKRLIDGLRNSFASSVNITSRTAEIEILTQSAAL